MFDAQIKSIFPDWEGHRELETCTDDQLIAEVERRGLLDELHAVVNEIKEMLEPKQTIRYVPPCQVATVGEGTKAILPDKIDTDFLMRPGSTRF